MSLEGAPFEPISTTQQKTYAQGSNGPPYLQQMKGQTPYAQGSNNPAPYLQQMRSDIPYTQGSFHPQTVYSPQQPQSSFGHPQPLLTQMGGGVNEALAFATTPPQNRFTYPFCPNAANPWHECSNYCKQRYSSRVAPSQQQRVIQHRYPAQAVQPNQEMIQERTHQERTRMRKIQQRQARQHQMEHFKNNLARMGYSYQDIIRKQQ